MLTRARLALAAICIRYSLTCITMSGIFKSKQPRSAETRRAIAHKKNECRRHAFVARDLVAGGALANSMPSSLAVSYQLSTSFTIFCASLPSSTPLCSFISAPMIFPALGASPAAAIAAATHCRVVASSAARPPLIKIK